MKYIIRFDNEYNIFRKYAVYDDETQLEVEMSKEEEDQLMAMRPKNVQP